jgi:hypothetical protein
VQPIDAVSRGLHALKAAIGYQQIMWTVERLVAEDTMLEEGS